MSLLKTRVVKTVEEGGAAARAGLTAGMRVAVASSAEFGTALKGAAAAVVIRAEAAPPKPESEPEPAGGGATPNNSGGAPAAPAEPAAATAAPAATPIIAADATEGEGAYPRTDALSLSSDMMATLMSANLSLPQP
eukprot:gene30322-6274_t